MMALPLLAPVSGSVITHESAQHPWATIKFSALPAYVNSKNEPGAQQQTNNAKEVTSHRAACLAKQKRKTRQKKEDRVGRKGGGVVGTGTYDNATLHQQP